MVPADAGSRAQEDAMFPIMQDPNVALTMARHRIDDRVNDACSRRASRIAYGARTRATDATPTRPRRRWRTFVVARRSIA